MAEEEADESVDIGAVGDTGGRDGSQVAHSFRVFSDRPASDLEALEWNCSMDLLACLTAPPDSTMSIYRLLSEDQSPKLLSEKVTGVGTALAWSPCGRKVVVGDRLGGVIVYDGESGAVLHTRRMHPQPVAAFSWVDASLDGSITGEPPWTRMLPPLLAVPSSPSNMYAEMPPDADVEALNSNSSSFSFLVSADEGGLIVVSAGGTFPLQATRLDGGEARAAPPSPSQASIPPCSSCTVAGDVAGAIQLELPCLAGRRPRAVSLSPELRCLAVLLGGPGSASLSSAADPRSPGTPTCGPQTPMTRQTSIEPYDEFVVVLDVRKLAIRRRELAQCSGMTEKLVGTVAYARQAVDALAHVWRGAADNFAGKMRALAQAIDDYAASSNGGSIHSELLMTCCTGSPSDAIQAFLTRQTSPQQLSRLERTLGQALEYVNLVVCTRLQAAGQHLLTVLHELQACAGWPQRFGAIGLSSGPLRNLMSRTQDLLRLTELLLLETSQAKRFLRTLFQVLLPLAQKLADQPTTAEPGAAAPSKEDMDEFMARMRQREPMDLAEITARIGARSGSQAQGQVSEEGSLSCAMQRLAADATEFSEQLARTLSLHVGLLACIPLRAASPWSSIAAADLRAVANADSIRGVPSPRGLGHPTLSITWETPATTAGSTASGRLLLLWSGGGGRESELHLCRVSIRPAPPGKPLPFRLEQTRLRASSVHGSPAHFVLCQAYDQNNVAALILNERIPPESGAIAAICLVDLSGHCFEQVPETSAICLKETLPLPAAISLEDLPAEVPFRRSADLPDSYMWASALRVMATRGVCSVYAWRARRLLTLDMQAEGEEEEEDED
mmetsp:Transcript_37477/g.74331  ORF Transcript_37477/g.74331 Transcript_37477/m.74331 type:complete len:841 (+) Transcript_37477:128-2650(+)